MTSHFFQYHLFKKFFLFFYLHLTFSGEGNGTPLQYSCLENPMDGGAWKAAVHGVAEGRARLSNFTFTFHFHALEKEMATHSSVLAWRIPGVAEPGGLPSMGLHRVGHDWSDLAAAANYFKSFVELLIFLHWFETVVLSPLKIFTIWMVRDHLGNLLDAIT